MQEMADKFAELSKASLSGNEGGNSSDSDETSETDLSFLDNISEEKEVQKIKTVDGQVTSAFKKIEAARENGEDELEIFNKLPKYLQEKVVKLDKQKNPDVYGEDTDGDDKEYVKKSDIQKVLKETLSDYESEKEFTSKQNDELNEIKKTIPKTVTPKQNKLLQKYFQENIEDGVKPARALKIAMQDAGVEPVKEKLDGKLPPAGAGKSTEPKKETHRFEKPKWLQ